MGSGRRAKSKASHRKPGRSRSRSSARKAEADTRSRRRRESSSSSSASRSRSRSRDAQRSRRPSRSRSLDERLSRSRSGSSSRDNTNGHSTDDGAHKGRRRKSGRRRRKHSPLSFRLKAIEYVTHGKLKKLRRLFRRQGSSPDAVASLESGGRRTLLHEACACGHARVVRLLLRLGAAGGLADAAGDTPAHLAARAGHLQALAEVMQAVDAPSVDLPGAGGDTLRDLMTQALGGGSGGAGERAGVTTGPTGVRANAHQPDGQEDDEAVWRRRLREEYSDGEGGGGDSDWGGGDAFGGPAVEDDDAWANRLWKEMQQRRRAAAAASTASFTANLREESARRAAEAEERSRRILQEEQAKDAAWRQRTVLAIEAGPAEPPLDLVAARATYDMRWEQLEAATSTSVAPRAPLQYWDIPWPLENPHGASSSSGKRPPPAHAPPPPRVDALRDFFLVGAAGPGDIKKRLRVELLRWHPDKFGARFRARLEAAGHEHRSCALARVTELAKVLTQVLSTG